MLSFLFSKGHKETKDYFFLESCFGGHLLILKGYIYRRKSLISGRSYWNCCSPKCFAKGVLLPEGEFQITNSKHNHKPDLENLKRKEKLVKLKKLALLVDVPGQILLEALQITEDMKKHLSLIRTWRRRNKKKNPALLNTRNPLNVGANYKLLPSRIPSKEMLFYSGYYFRQDSVNPQNDKCKYWRCKVKKCKARAKTDHEGSLTILQPFHSHTSGGFDETFLHLDQMLKAPSSSAREHISEIMDEQDHPKCKDSKNSSLIVKKISEVSKKEEVKEVADSTATMEETNCGFFPSETFSFDKLMTETLDETYCVPHEFRESLNVLKSE